MDEKPLTDIESVKHLLTPSELKVYEVLCSFDIVGDGAYPSLAKLGDKSDITEDHAGRCLRQLYIADCIRRAGKMYRTTVWATPYSSDELLAASIPHPRSKSWLEMNGISEPS